MSREEHYRTRLERQRSASVTGRDPQRSADTKNSRLDAIVDCGWGRLIFAHTFSDNHKLADVLLEESPGKRDIAYIWVDKANRRLGTPAHAMILASTKGLSDAYQVCIEERLASLPDTGGTVNPDIGADMVLLSYPNGGAVFSVGSISWLYTLSANAYEGDTSCMTENVLREFSRGR